jgi:hypothetical protein
VAVTVQDEAGKPLQGVVISLSGEGYRSNNPTNQQGIFTVSALHPGSYYLRPLLKEYVFTPSSTVRTPAAWRHLEGPWWHR